MSRYVSNRNSDGKTDENGHFRLPLKLVDGEILQGFELEAQSTPNMTIKVTAGEAKIPYDDYAYAVWSDEDENLNIQTASTTADRIDRVVAYVDRTMTFEETDVNHPGALKFLVVRGTAASSPLPPTDTQVQSAVGAGNPFIDLGEVTVQANTTGITSTNISMDTRIGMSLSPEVQVEDFTMADGGKFKLIVQSASEDLPAPIEGTTLIVLQTKD